MLPYKQRAKIQAFRWACGYPSHNRLDNECCPDFSCCFPDMMETDANKRWQYYKENFGSIEQQQNQRIESLAK